MSDEQRLPGGNTGGAVRIGDTVRRVPGQWTPSVHAVLRHLENAGFEGAPRALGFDEQGREVLSFLPGEVVGNTRPWPNDAAPYNAAWADGRLVGFFDWDFAAPATAEWDLAFTAFAWIPLHARHVVAAEGFTAFAERPRRLRLFLDAYGWSGSLGAFIEIVRRRVSASADGIRRIAASGDPAYQQMIERGIDLALEAAVNELADFPDQEPGPRQA